MTFGVVQTYFHLFLSTSDSVMTPDNGGRSTEELKARELVEKKTVVNLIEGFAFVHFNVFCVMVYITFLPFQSGREALLAW